MKTVLIKKGLSILRRLALINQVGNVNRKAPSLASDPEEHEKIFGPFGDKNNLFVWHLHNVVCSGLYGGAVVNKFNELYLRFTSFAWGKELHPALSLPYLGQNVKTVDKAVFLVTPEAVNNYYHWVVDLLPRLLLLFTYELDDLKDRYIIIHNSPKSYENDSLELLGIEKAKIIRLNSFETINANDLIVADYSGLNKPFPKWKKQLLTTLNTGTRVSDKKKIYLLRGAQAKRQLIGEDRLISLLESRGFDIVDPQKLTFHQQISTLQQAEVVVALHGAALTNIIFCDPGTLVIELRSTHLPPEHYSSIAETYNFKFETISLPPERLVQKNNKANKQSLVLTEQAIDTLISKLKQHNK